jgi:diguanylate cyclase (GGDEF)-like protein/PAS domain S-box-containing protein
VERATQDIVVPPILPANAPAAAGDRRLALGVCALAVLAFAVAAPFARVPLRELSAFVPASQAALVVCTLITAAIVAAQFKILRVRALAVLALGYGLTAAIAFLQLLAVSGLSPPAMVFSAGPQASAWLTMIWHATLPAAVVGYAALKERSDPPDVADGAANRVGVTAMALTFAIVAILAFVAAAGQTRLPDIVRDTGASPMMAFAVSTVWALSFTALALLWSRRPGTLLDTWLTVVMCAWIFDVALSAVFNAGPFDLGFYAGRIYGLVAGAFVLLAQLLRVGTVHARYAEALMADHEERKRQMEERRHLFDTTLDLILITDRRGRFVRVSPSATAIVGYTPEEMVGRSAVCFMHPGDLDNTRNEMRRARRGKEIRNFEARYVHKLGRDVPLAWTGVWSDAVHLFFFIGRDMTEQHKAERALRDSERHFRLLVGAVTDYAVYMLDPNGNVTSWNAGAERIKGYKAEEIIGRHFSTFYTPEDRAAGVPAAALANAARDGKYRTEGWRVRKDGERFFAAIAVDAIYADSGELLGFAKITRDITELKQAEKRLEYLAHYDDLTGLPNRITLQRDLKMLLEPAAAGEAAPTTIALIDLDGFKDINDTLGHSTGDRLLRAVAQRLSETVTGATIYRLGGDEFVILFPRCGDPRFAASAVAEARASLAAPFDIDGRPLYIGASAGIAIAPGDGSTVDELIANADLALYDAKSQGGRQHRLFVPVLRAKAEARRQLDLELRRAFFAHEFEMFFQPQIRLRDDAVVGAEALLRWRHPTKGLIAPGAFIEALAESAIAREVGSWILRNTCATVAAWRANGLPTVRVGVNLFPVQFRHETLLQDVEQALDLAKLPGDALELEITENIAIDNDDKILPTLTELRRRGVDLAFDDFGTGYASLSYLTRYPLTRIKIDQSFVRNINATAQGTAIVRSTVIMAHNLGLQVIAEGVETPAQAAFLRAEGCDQVQGFLYAKALPRAEFEDFVRRRSAPGEAMAARSSAR